MKVVSVVPIKMNNERLPGKNTKLLGDKPLIQYILNTLKQTKEIDDTYVFCSNEEIQNYMIPGAKFLKRSEELDKPTTNFTQIFEEFMKEVDADIYVYAHATAPFVRTETISKCIENVKSGEYDSAFTAEKIQDFLWKDGKPVNFDPTNLPRSQDLPFVYRETSGVYCFTKDVFEKYRRRIGEKPYIVEVDEKEMIDINYPKDFEKAKKYISLD